MTPVLWLLVLHTVLEESWENGLWQHRKVRLGPARQCCWLLRDKANLISSFDKANSWADWGTTDSGQDLFGLKWGVRQQASWQLQAHDVKACGQCVRQKNRWTRLPSPSRKWQSTEDPQRQCFVLHPSARWMNTVILQIAKQKQVFIWQSIPRLPYIPAQTRIFTTKQKCENILFPWNVLSVLILCVYTYESLRALVHLWRPEEVSSLLPPCGALERFDLGRKMSCPSERSCWPFSSHLIENKQTKRSLGPCCREKTPWMSQTSGTVI